MLLSTHVFSLPTHFNDLPVYVTTRFYVRDGDSAQEWHPAGVLRWYTFLIDVYLLFSFNLLVHSFPIPPFSLCVPSDIFFFLPSFFYFFLVLFCRVPRRSFWPWWFCRERGKSRSEMEALLHHRLAFCICMLGRKKSMALPSCLSLLILRKKKDGNHVEDPGD